jgi:hypothetical protein
LVIRRSEANVDESGAKVTVSSSPLPTEAEAEPESSSSSLLEKVLESKGGKGVIVEPPPPPEGDDFEGKTLTIVVGDDADMGSDGFGWEPVVVETLEMGKLRINVKKNSK